VTQPAINPLNLGCPVFLNEILHFLTNIDRQYFAAIFTENLREAGILSDR